MPKVLSVPFFPHMVYILYIQCLGKNWPLKMDCVKNSCLKAMLNRQVLSRYFEGLYCTVVSRFNVYQRAGTDPCTTSGSALFRRSDARHSSHTHRTGPSCFFCCCSIHLDLYLLTFDCTKTFSLSNATWKPIYSNSLSPPLLHQAPLYLQT